MRNLETGVSLPEHLAVQKRPYVETLRFLYDAEKAKVPEKIKETLAPTPQSLNKFNRSLDVITRYYTTEATLACIAEEEQVSANEIHRRRNFGVTKIWNFSPIFLQTCYPIDELTLGKPISTATKRKNSQSHNGIAIKVEKALQSGKSITEIVENFSIDKDNLVRIRRTLRGWNTKLPHVYGAYESAPLLEKVNPHKLTDTKKQDLIDKQTLRTLYLNTSEDNLFISLKEVVEAAGNKYVNHLGQTYAEEIKYVCIPMREISYVNKKGTNVGLKQTNRFLFRADLDRAVMALKYNPKFDKYKKEDF